MKALGFQLLELFESKVLSKFWFQMSTCTPTARTYAAWGVDYLKYDNCYAVRAVQVDIRLTLD